MLRFSYRATVFSNFNRFRKGEVMRAALKAVLRLDPAEVTVARQAPWSVPLIEKYVRQTN